MNFGGLIRISLSDYPSRVASCFFTQGCNFNCIYCHNSHLIKSRPLSLPIKKDVYAALKKGKDFVDGIVISGGEPTLQKGLPMFLEEIKKMGLQVKLDTNGTKPACLKSLISNGLVDYIAMDIKAPLEKYEEITKVIVNWRKIEESIQLISEAEGGEFRTTVVRPHLTKEDIRAIGRMVQNAGPLILQKLVSKNTSLSTINEPQQIWLSSLANDICQTGTSCIVR